MINESNKKVKKRGGIVEYLAMKTELPTDLLAGEFRIELRGRNTLFVQGCRRIVKYSPEEMIFAAKGFEVSVSGENLVCSTYHDGTVTIDGYIGGILLDKEVEEK